jgi:signal transduction histidine kinase/ActR/RegA family two-component response regulator
VLDGETVRGVEFAGTTPARPGIVRTWLNNWVPLRNRQGEIIGITISAEEITQERAAQEALRTAARQKDEFLAMLSHELRNPLAPIRNAAVLLLRESGDDPRVATLAAMVNRNSQQLARLLDDLLDVSRIVQNRIVLKTEPLEIDEVIAPAIEMVQSLVSEKSHKLRVDRPGQPLYVRADRARLVQCLCNLLNNSAKYTDPGGEIMLTVTDVPDNITFEIRDNGAGISPELLPQIFEPFTQGDRSLDRSHGGLGIGLSIVKRLVDMHQGTVSAASAGLGSGTTFSIRLPRIEPPDRAAIDASGRSAPPHRILVVDDSPDAADSLAMLLRLEGHEVTTANSSAGALEAVRCEKPEVIFLDIGLPYMNGYEIARQLRADPRTAAIRVIALSGYGQEHDRKRSVEAGFDAHLVKPADIEAVNQILAALPTQDETPSV